MEEEDNNNNNNNNIVNKEKKKDIKNNEGFKQPKIKNNFQTSFISGMKNINKIRRVDMNFIPSNPTGIQIETSLHSHMVMNDLIGKAPTTFLNSQSTIPLTGNRTQVLTQLQKLKMQKSQQQNQQLKKSREENLMKEKKGYPSRKIFVPKDMELFFKSKCYFILKSFILELNALIKGKSLTSIKEQYEKHKNPLIDYFIKNLFPKMKNWLKEYPKVQEKGISRFGNIAYRFWFDRIGKESEGIMNELLKIAIKRKNSFNKNKNNKDKDKDKKNNEENENDENDKNNEENEPEKWMIKELSSYFRDSFGNRTRIDYGTGHEVTFIAFVCCFAQLELLTNTDMLYFVGIVFPEYLKLCREVQLFYNLEPAGSRGVWGLDDFQFLPFLWGASQLIGQKMFTPKSIHNQEVIDYYSKDYLYFSGIQFIKKVKTGPFGEHSPLLNDISAVKKWEKVNSGMIKMYSDEVLKKFVVIQHFLFGKLLSFETLKR